MISSQIRTATQNIKNSTLNFYSAGNTALFIDFIHKVSSVRDLSELPRVRLESVFLDVTLENESQFPILSMVFWSKLGIDNISAGGRFLNDRFLFLHNLWITQHEYESVQDSPYLGIVRIMERGGYIWKHHGEYHVGERAISLRYLMTNNLVYQIPSYDSDFLDYIDSMNSGSELMSEKEMQSSFELWKDLRNNSA